MRGRKEQQRDWRSTEEGVRAAFNLGVAGDRGRPHDGAVAEHDERRRAPGGRPGGAGRPRRALRAGAVALALAAAFGFGRLTGGPDAGAAAGPPADGVTTTTVLVEREAGALAAPAGDEAASRRIVAHGGPCCPDPRPEAAPDARTVARSAKPTSTTSSTTSTTAPAAAPGVVGLAAADARAALAAAGFEAGVVVVIVHDPALDGVVVAQRGGHEIDVGAYEAP